MEVGGPVQEVHRHIDMGRIMGHQWAELAVILDTDLAAHEDWLVLPARQH
jgi:hypothetical protein